MLSSIVGTIETTFFRLDDCIDAVGIGSGNRDANLAQDSARKSVSLQALPCDAVVFRPIKAAARAAAGEKPWLASRLPKGCEDDVRIMRIENNVDPAGVFIFRQHFGPRLAAIARAKNSTLLIWTKRMTERRHQNYICISWIDNQRADLPR